MDDLVAQLKVTQATMFSFMLKAWNFHWNVTGPNFSEYHAFFGTIYEETAARVDIVSEHIRICDAKAPGSLSKFIELSKIADTITDVSASGMITELTTNNRTLMEELRKAKNEANVAGKIGVVNDLEDLIAQHDKLAWMLKSMI